MNGTCITINQSQQVKAFMTGNTDSFGDIKYKTVNIYSISLTSWRCIIKKLDQHISDGKVNDYYETVFAEMIADGSLSFKTVSFDCKPWYEIDTMEDLAEAEKLFPSDNYTTAKTIPFSQHDIFHIPLIDAVASRYKATGILNVTK